MQFQQHVHVTQTSKAAHRSSTATQTNVIEVEGTIPPQDTPPSMLLPSLFNNRLGQVKDNLGSEETG